MKIDVYLPDVVGKGYGSFWRTKKRYRVVKGSRASKKSKTTALNMIVRLIEYPLANALCVRRYAKTLRDSMFADLKWAIKRLKLTDQFEWTVSPMEIVYKPTGQKILFRGLDDGVKITSISTEVGVICFVWVEEAYEIEESDFDKLDLSIRGEVPDGYFKQITMIFNPWSATSWLKGRFFDEPDDDTFVQTTTWECNEWLDDADKKVFKKMKSKNPRRYKIEGEGEWGIAEGLIYTNVVREPVDVDELRKKPGIISAFGLDFGFTDPTAFICMLIDTVELVIYVFDEWYSKGVTNKQIAAMIKSMGYGTQIIYCDHAEPKSIAELQEEGISNAEPAEKGRDSVNYGIQHIQNYKLVVDPRCVNFDREVKNYCWEKDKNGNQTGKPSHEFSHGQDAMRYAVTMATTPSTFSFD